MAQDISGLYISQSFQNLIQRSESGAFNVLATATGTEFIPISASYAISASHLQGSVTSASYALSASHANSSNTSISASHAVRADSALSSSYALTASYAENATINTLQQVLTAGNSASVNMILTSSLFTTASVTEHKNEFKVTAEDKDTEFDVDNFKIKNNGTGKTIITGSLIVSSSANSVFDIDLFDLEITGGLDVSRDVAVRDDLTVYDDTNLRKDTNIGFDGASPGFGYSLIVTQSNNNSGSARFIGDVDITGSLEVGDLADVKGLLWASGSYASINGALYVGATGTGAAKSINVGATNYQQRYGQIIINGNTSTYAGNNISEFIVQDNSSLNNMIFGISSFTNAGNNVHEIKMGADQTLDASLGNLKIYASASSPNLNINADTTVFNPGGNIQMSGSINLAGIGTGSSGQVIESGADGIAKWATAAGGAAFPFTGSAQITGSLAVTGSTVLSTDVESDETYPLETLGNAKVRKNVSGQNATLIIQDDAQNSFSDGPTLQFSGSSVGLIKSQANTNLKIAAERDFEISIGGGSGAQFQITKANNASGKWSYVDQGSSFAQYSHENINNGSGVNGSGSIAFKVPNVDTGIKVETNAVGGAKLQFFSGSSYNPIIAQKLGAPEINLYDTNQSTGSVDQVLKSNANGGIQWGTSGTPTFQADGFSYTQATAPGCDYVFSVALIPGGTFAAGDVLEFRILDTKASSAGTTYITVAITSGTVSAGTAYPGTYSQIAGNQSSGDGKLYYQKTLFIQSATSTTVFAQGNANETSTEGFSGPTNDTYNIDWTQDQTVWYGACIDNAGTTLTNHGWLFRKIS